MDVFVTDGACMTSAAGQKPSLTYMALMVTDTYDQRERTIFRDGMRRPDEASRKASNASFMSATPQQRLSLLESLDREPGRRTRSGHAQRGGRRPVHTHTTPRSKAALREPGRRDAGLQP